jgi:hypothetical protein
MSHAYTLVAWHDGGDTIEISDLLWDDVQRIAAEHRAEGDEVFIEDDGEMS